MEEQPGLSKAGDAALRKVQVVGLALIIGLLLSGGLLGFWGLTKAASIANAGGTAKPVSGGGPSGTGGVDPFLWLLVGVGALSLTFVVLAPGLLVKQARKQWEARADDESAMSSVYQGFLSLSVLQFAMIEGPGLLGAVVTLITGNWLMLIATGVSVLMMAALFPRRSRMERWVEEVTGAPSAG